MPAPTNIKPSRRPSYVLVYIRKKKAAEASEDEKRDVVRRAAKIVVASDKKKLEVWLEGIYDEVKVEPKNRRRVSVFIKEDSEMEEYKKLRATGGDDDAFFSPVLNISGDSKMFKLCGVAASSATASATPGRRAGSRRGAKKDESKWGTSAEAAEFMLQSASPTGLLYVLAYEMHGGFPRGPKLNIAESLESDFPPLKGDWTIDLLTTVVDGIQEQLFKKRVKRA